MEEKTQNNEQKAGQELDEQLSEHSYDGIQELDNPPPSWVMAIFYLTIGFSIIYAAYFFWLDVGDSQTEKYAKKSELHDVKYQMVSQETAEIGRLTDASELEAGRSLFTSMTCFACHGMNGEGNAVGPNLTDEYWIHGCDFTSIFNMIKNGNPAKGMTAFKTQLSDSKIQQVASFVMSLQGTNPANAKAAQGEKCE